MKDEELLAKDLNVSVDEIDKLDVQLNLSQVLYLMGLARKDERKGILHFLRLKEKELSKEYSYGDLYCFLVEEIFSYLRNKEGKK